MKKNGKIICDGCKKEFTPSNDIAHNYIKLGWRTKTGNTTNKNLDACKECMRKVYAIFGLE